MRKFLALLLLLSMSSFHADATAIVVHIGKKDIWIAADGLNTQNYNGDPYSWKTKVKVHPAFGGLIALYGYESDPAQPELGTLSKVLQDQIAKAKNLEDFKVSLPREMNDAMRKMQSPLLEAVKRNARDTSPTGYFDSPYPQIDLGLMTGILFIGLDQKQLKVERLEIRPSLTPESTGYLRVAYGNVAWEDLHSRAMPYLFPGRLFALPSDADKVVRKNPRKGTLALVKRVAADHPCYVGAPFVAARINLDRRHKTARIRWSLPVQGSSWEIVDARQPEGCKPGQP